MEKTYETATKEKRPAWVTIWLFCSQTWTVRRVKGPTVIPMVSLRVKQCRVLLSVWDKTYSAGVQTTPGGTLSLLAIKVWLVEVVSRFQVRSQAGSGE